MPTTEELFQLQVKLLQDHDFIIFITNYRPSFADDKGAKPSLAGRKIRHTPKEQDAKYA
jgi:hypothetical protein